MSSANRTRFTFDGKGVTTPAVAEVVEEDVAARVIVHALEEHFEGYTVVEVFAWVDFEAEVQVGFVEGIEDGTPAGG